MQIGIEKKVTSILARADVQVGGNRPGDIQIKDRQFFRKLLWDGSLGLGEAYVDGYFECEQIDVLCYKLVKYEAHQKSYEKSQYLNNLLGLFINLQSIKNSLKVAKKHYDIKAEIFKKFLDKHMLYSCGYWHKAKNLQESQEKKMDLIAKKLGLKKGMKVLDVGCGWGGGAVYLANRYQVSVTGITISKGQYQYALKHNAHKRVQYLLIDYRNHRDVYDAIYSIGMFEHVGDKNHSTYFEKMKSCLTEEGNFLLHTIGRHFTPNSSTSWIAKHIFPNSEIPSQKQLVKSMEELFIIDDWHNFGCDYDKTLMQWYKKFIRSYTSFRDEYYDNRFFRTWSFYLLSCAGLFRARYLQLWQVLLTPTHSTRMPCDIPKVR